MTTLATDTTKEITRRSWYTMAREGYPWIITEEVCDLVVTNNLEIIDIIHVLWIGRAKHLELKLAGMDRSDEIIRSPTIARALRIYYAYCDGRDIGRARTLKQVEINIGIRNQDGEVKEEWR